MKRKRTISRKEALRIGSITAFVLTGCDRVINSFLPSPTFENTTAPTVKATETQNDTSTPTPTYTPESTKTPTQTPTPEVIDWIYVSQHTDEEIFNKIGIPNPEDYSLHVEIAPNKILRNEGGQSYALFQNSEGIVLLAENLETLIVEHAVFAEFENGVPLMILTSNDVVEKDNGWFKLNEDYPALDAQVRLGEAINRGLSFNWWAANHPEDFSHRRMNSLDEIPGFHAMNHSLLTRTQRSQVSYYMLNSFTNQVKEAREEGRSIILNFPDRNKSQLDITKDTLIIKPILNDSVTPNWQQVLDGMAYNKDIRNVSSERSGLILTLKVKQPAFMPNRDSMSPIGGFVTNFIRYFFGGEYFERLNSDPDYKKTELYDLTGGVVESMCKVESIPNSILYYYNFSYLTNADTTYPIMNNCAVVFGK